MFTAMNLITKPSFSTCDYIRRLLQQHADELKLIMSQKAEFCAGSQVTIGFCATSQVTLKQLFQILYIEDTLEELLKSLYLEETEISLKAKQLEKLILRYQNTIAKNPSDYKELGELKQQVFLILGFKRVVVKIEDLIIALNQLSKLSNNLLGATLTLKNWQSTRPNFDWLDNFQINRSTEMTFSGVVTESVTAFQLQWIQEWVTAFINQGSQFIRDFSTIIEQKRIGELQGGILLSRVSSYSSWLTDKTKAV